MPNFSKFLFLIIGQSLERCGLAKLAMLLVVQLGLEHVDLLRSILPVAVQMSQDHTVAAGDRAEVSGIVVVMGADSAMCVCMCL